MFFFLFPTLGDAVVMTGPLGWFRRRYPEARIVVATSALARPILEACPFVDEVWLRPRSRIAAMLGFVARLRRERFDLGINTYGQNNGLLMMGLGRMGAIVGMKTSKYARFYDAWDESNPDENLVVEGMARIARMVDVEPGDWRPAFTIPPEMAQGAREWLVAEGLGPGEPYVAIQVGASNPNKAWPLARFLEIAARVEAAGVRCVYVGGPAEASALAAVGKGRGLNLAGKLEVLETAEVLRGARLLVTNDSGPMHLAGGVGTRCVAIYGPTRPINHPPYGEGHVLIPGACACARKDQDSCLGTCIAAVGVGEVWQGIEHALNT